MVLYLNIVVKNSSSIVEESIEKRTGRGILSQVMYHIASLIIQDTAVTDRVATACLEGLEATLKGEHSLQVEVTKRGVWGSYFVLEVRLVGVPLDAVSKSKGLLVGSMINLFRVTACSDASYTNAMVFRNAERLLQQRLPSEIAHKLAENGVDADVVIKSDKKEQELYQTVMVHQASQEEDSDDESDDWSFESDYVFVNRSDAIIDEASAVRGCHLGEATLSDGLITTLFKLLDVSRRGVINWTEFERLPSLLMSIALKPSHPGDPLPPSGTIEIPPVAVPMSSTVRHVKLTLPAVEEGQISKSSTWAKLGLEIEDDIHLASSSIGRCRNKSQPRLLKSAERFGKYEDSLTCRNDAITPEVYDIPQ
ncbi:hypothetical protein FOZ63_006596 [Perkinsus olseni]|uniref:EF-hand domain-containing protein n=1 Tax=Perkinsus olseni TaxID=32597 RepID=A0A7J6SHN9_PEROL|nr:hypothetical protein FOZ63_006596 [Perkinsus olseni]KAF4731896.1 hypothetical protein FOZ62_026585 [Perkinsus olseni]